MTRDELIHHWEKDIIPAVFVAENKLLPQLKTIVDDYKDDTKRACELYAHMIAEEIVSHTSDEEIAKM